METILITGGTGLVGSALTRLLISKGYDVIILSRSKKESKNGIRYAQWNVGEATIDEDAVRAADVIIHLAGAGVADKRWTKQRKQEILESRTLSSALLVKALTEIPNKVHTVISSSAIGWYGPDTAESLADGFHEDAPADHSYLGETCRLWEQSIEPVTALGKRLVKLRTGIVLSRQGGALVEFIKPLKTGVAAILGNGKQVISWIHINDLCRQFLYAIENTSLEGAYNAVAPNPVTNKELTLQLANLMRGKWFIPVYVPAFVLKIMLGEMSIEVLKSAKVSADKILETGFHFQYAKIDEALADLINSNRESSAVNRE
jgi:uncharacterized protein (TIGR01777 family)